MPACVLLKKIRRIAAASIVAFLLTGMAIPSNAVAEKEYRFQQSGALTGTFYIELSKNSFAGKNPKLCVEMYTKAPDWKVQMFNNRSRKKFAMPVAKFKGSYTVRVALGDAGTLKLLNWKKVGEENIAGIDTDHLVATGPAKDPKKELVLNTTRVKKIDYWVAKASFTTPEVARMMSNVYSVPELDRFPIGLEILDIFGRKQVVLNTRTLLASSMKFEPPDPKGYTPAKSESELFFLNIDALLKDSPIQEELKNMKW